MCFRIIHHFSKKKGIAAYLLSHIPVVPRKAVAEVSKIGSPKESSVGATHRWQGALMDRKVVEALHFFCFLSLFLYLFVCLSCYLFVYLSDCLSVYLSAYLFVCLYIYISTYLFVYLPIYLPIYLSTYVPIYLSTYLPIYLSIYANGS